MSVRTDKVASLVQMYLGVELHKLELPYMTTISKVEITPDLKHAKVWLTIMPAGEANEAEVLEILRKEVYELQQMLLGKLATKIIPRVHFVIDHSEEYASHINALLKKTDETE